MDLSIIIVNWNTAELLIQCLESVYKNGSRYSFEVIVVDNGSNDGSPSLVAEQFPEVILIRNDQNLGFAPANNQGLSRGTGRYFMLLNSDTVVLPGVLDAMIQLADNHPEVGVLGPRLLNMDNTIQESWASFPSFLSELLGKDFRVSQPVAKVPHAYDVDIVKGACMLVRSETIAEAGPLDGDFFFYSEEIDWCYRIKKKNWKVWYLMDIEIYHLGGGSTQAGFLQMVRLYRGKLLYFNKHHGRFRTMLLRYGLAIGNGVSVVRRVLFFNWKNREAARNRIDNQAKLVWCLLRNQYPEPGLARTNNK
jgi:GT2 family glycosyltransferase